MWGGILAILALRLLLEVRECRTATLGFTLAFSFWAAALATDYGWLTARRACHAGGDWRAAVGASVFIVQRGVLRPARAAGCGRVVESTGGKAEARKARKKVKAAGDDAAGKAESTKTSRIDAAHKGVPQPNAAPLAAHVKTASSNSGSSGSSSSGNSYGSAAAAKSTAANRYGSSYTDRDEDEDRYSDQRSGQGRFDDETDDEDDSYGGGNRKLSKAERKRLRKQMRHQGRDEE